ncbi:DUF2141 domain-containing protein [Salegentibacter sp. F188]|uniref:DUF2141 domain-containing protein n=1 Tax=Autumnicola patrickiae TaxID=3075591 RepID=A0ABU3DZC1_9FLAO|nr:DUF2141 domain-containing protein [Salegentibacter sp. F188]MDT0689046.1 DUF2141 domain-containing protein [Salegentibacter sp. F188]
MKILAVLASIFFFNFATAQENQEEKGRITVTVSNATSDEGEVLFGVYTEDTFMKAEPEFRALSEVKDGVAKATFDNIPEGTYAIIALHDRNGNKRMDFDSSGMPMESYGTSGNSMPYGPPQWQESKFSYDQEPQNIEIRF